MDRMWNYSGQKPFMNILDHKDQQRMMVYPMFMIVQNLRLCLTAIAPTAVAPTADQLGP